MVIGVGRGGWGVMSVDRKSLRGNIRDKENPG